MAGELIYGGFKGETPEQREERINAMLVSEIRTVRSGALRALEAILDQVDPRDIVHLVLLKYHGFGGSLPNLRQVILEGVDMRVERKVDTLPRIVQPFDGMIRGLVQSELGAAFDNIAAGRAITYDGQ